MTRQEAQRLSHGSIEELRLAVSELGNRLHTYSESDDRWIACSSKRDLLGELIYLYANNRHETPAIGRLEPAPGAPEQTQNIRNSCIAKNGEPF